MRRRASEPGSTVCLSPYPGRRLGHGRTARARRQRQCLRQRIDRRRACVQSQHIRDGAACVLFGQGVVPFRQQAAVESFLNLWNPTNMKSVEDSGFNACPVMHGHG